MGKSKGAHHRGTYHVDSRRVRAAANANPGTTCWRCGRTLAEHPPHHTGKPATWHAGHVNDGEINGTLRAEASTCNIAAGNAARARSSGRAQRWTPPTTTESDGSGLVS